MAKSRDDRLLELFDFIDRYQELQKQCFTDLAKAYFDLAQARYIMGTRKLSPLNFDQRMKAIAKVVPDTKEESLDVDNLMESFSKLSLQRVSTSSEPTKSAGTEKQTKDGDDATLVDADSAKEGTVRRRKPRMASEDAEEESSKDVEAKEGQKGEKDSESRDDNGKPPSEPLPKEAAGALKPKKSTIADEGLRDPLKWFGVLVPPPLRSSQKHFQNVVDQLVVLANMKHEAMALQDEYETEAGIVKKAELAASKKQSDAKEKEEEETEAKEETSN